MAGTEGVDVTGLLTPSADEMDALVAMGVEIGAEPVTEAGRDAYVSQLLYVDAQLAREEAMGEEARAAEHRRIDLRYDTRLAPVKRQRAYLQALVKAEALRAFAGKTKGKSRTVGFGAYGCKKKPETVEIVDEAALLAWAMEEETRATIVKATVALPLPELMAKAPDLFPVAKLGISKSGLNAMSKATDEELPGTHVVAAHDVPWVETADLPDETPAALPATLGRVA